MRALALLLLLTCGQAWGVTYYIDCTAGSNGTGTFASPYWGVSATNGNDNSNLNWTNIGTGDDDVLFKAGTSCNNSKMGGTAGFPTGLNVAGSAGDLIRIGIYDPATGAEITDPTAAQRVVLAGDGSTRTEMISLFGWSYAVVSGFDCSGGSNSSGRGCIAIGANGATPASNLLVTKNRLTQGASPTNTTNMYGVSVGGTSSGTTTSDVVITGNEISGLRGSSGAFGVLVSNAERVSVTGNTIDATGFTATTTGGILVQTSTDGRAALAGSTITGNAITGGMHGIRYAPFGATTTYSRLSGAVWTGNTLTEQTVHGIYASVLQGGLVSGNTIAKPGFGTGAGAGIYISAATGYVGSGDAAGTVITGNTITDAGQFAIHIVGLRNITTTRNRIERCGTIALANTFGRCIELTRLGTITFPAQAVTLSAATGLGVTATAAGAVFASTDVDRLILAPTESTGVCRITAFTSSTVVTCDVLQDFSTTTLASARWAFGNIAHYNYVIGNQIEKAYGRQYLTSQGSEGIGIGVDDYTSLSQVLRNFVKDTDYGAIDVNSGQGNLIASNVLYNGGDDPNDVLAANNVRRSSIRMSYSGSRVIGNSINCAGNRWGIAAENSTTVSPTSVAHGGVNEFRNNVLVNCGGGILGNSNDLASNNSYYGNTANYQWMAQLSFSSAPTGGDLTTQTLDGASITADPKFLGGPNPTTAEGFRPGPGSPLCGAGTPIDRGMNDFIGINFAGIPAIGAMECGVPRVTLVAANRIDLTAANRVDMSSTNRVTRTDANTVRLQ